MGPCIQERTFHSSRAYLTSSGRLLRTSLKIVVLTALTPLLARAASDAQIPRISTPPRLEDFEDMKPHGAATELRKISGFTQQQPSDGKPATQPTDVYIGYDATRLYVVWVCWDSKPHAVRAHLSRREAVTPPDDDYVELIIDTFHDQRHGFLFDVNPMGTQADALWTEGSGADYSFDTVWESRARLTTKGFIIRMAIPFRSLRFHPSNGELWGATFMRYIAHNDEVDYWPYVSSRISGVLNQEGTISGLQDISPSHNMQFIPYASFRNFRAVDTRDPSQPRFNQIDARGKAGLDSKFVFHDSLVLDTTINPAIRSLLSGKAPFLSGKRELFWGHQYWGVPSLTIAVYKKDRGPDLRRASHGKAGPVEPWFFLC